ncbi:DMT family transporter [Paenibacillus aquistagni]|uniref:Multidrug resistance protein EbrA n=1 Tax=Paenibacillus aquistagni TaxID=1852522 RepID=A0A1X7J7R9_9BACL|nr:multidrug efflux SMR transporter [Paenibacillus aquistagni]NMM52573.1 multidrug efflux SMR transporter [Paenibacillus aquistagni]SMG23781.1 multidrug resistance protein EbrA [Paenibacillus aquistagni]
MSYLWLGLAIIMEVFGSTMLKLSNGFKRWLPVVGLIAGYGLAFWLLSYSLKSLPLGLVYATWSGVGTILTVLTGMWIFKERMNRQAWLGMAILIVGIVMLNATK